MARGQEHADLLVAARRDRDHLAYLKQVYLKLGSQVKAYEEIAGITNDMLKAIVFYMALLLPFCFFVQKLLFKFVKLELQLLTFAVLFVGTFVVFRMIHPAFRVAQAPEAIFIGFVMGVLGLFVISILHGRFEGEMQLLFMTYAGMDESQVGYSAVGQKAMLIGVNNMKRRRVRTSLTTTTIVLVTFTMLAFSSVSKKMSPTVVPVSKETSYNGLFYQWPGNLLMDEATLRAFRELVDDVSSRVIVRRWLMPASATQYSAFQPFPLGASNGRAISVDAALGLSTVEQDFLGPIPILPGGRFFSNDEAAEVVLPAAAAAALGLAGDDVGTATVSFKGHVLRLVGIMDDARFRALRDLNDRPILPIKDIQRGGASQSARDASVQSDPTADESGVFYVDASALLIVPLGTGRRMGAKPFSISIELKDGVSVWDAMGAVMTATRAKFYIGSVTPFALGKEGKRRTGAGIYYVGSGESTSIGGLTRLLIPLLIAATIILNTMLGAVYERKSEIAVYNAIGLNPTHIGLFFLAEAFVYSVIGSVGGYLIGQLLTIAITKFDLVQGINLNFSSLSVVYVILFTIAVVLLSTLYPAVVATRAAVPSGKRKWSMPPLDGNRMSVAFPFIYQPALARGAMAYLDEYFARFTEASVGELIARRAVAGQSQDTAGRETYTLVYDVALAPFDLGVTQDVKLEASYDEVVESYRINLTITRKSGQDSNWVTTNRPFLEKMRQYLMHWRNLEAVTHNEYGRMADSLFLS